MAKKETVALRPTKLFNSKTAPRIFVLSNKPYPRHKTIPCQCDIEDDREGKDGTTCIQYVKGQSTIYADEHYKRGTTKLVPEVMSFIEGIMIVPPSNKALLRFIEKSTFLVGGRNHNPSSSLKFFEYNADQVAKDSLTKEDAMIDALHIIKEQSKDADGLNTLVNYAELIGINIEAPTSVILSDLRNIAKSDPQAFLDGFGDKLIKTKWWVIKASKLKYITINEQDKNILSQSGLPIFTASRDSLKSDLVPEFCMHLNSDEGGKQFDAIKDFVLSKV